VRWIKAERAGRGCVGRCTKLVCGRIGSVAGASSEAKDESESEQEGEKEDKGILLHGVSQSITGTRRWKLG
jgi:hypothetical protein